MLHGGPVRQLCGGSIHEPNFAEPYLKGYWHREKQRMSAMSAHEIQKRIRDLGNQEIARHSQRFFKTAKGEYGEGDRFLGIRVPVLRKLANQHQGTSLETVFQLLSSEFHEERLFSLLILVLQFFRGNEKERRTIYEGYLKNTRFVNNWDLVDSSAVKIVGAYLLERSRAPLYRLVHSKNLWERRISIIATFYFIKRNDVGDTLKLSEILKQDPEDLIHKAVGWMLREIGNRDRAIEEGFLKKHYREMPRTMLRYAIEKFPEDKRQAYLKGTV